MTPDEMKQTAFHMMRRMPVTWRSYPDNKFAVFNCFGERLTTARSQVEAMRLCRRMDLVDGKNLDTEKDGIAGGGERDHLRKATARLKELMRKAGVPKLQYDEACKSLESGLAALEPGAGDAKTMLTNDVRKLASSGAIYR